MPLTFAQHEKKKKSPAVCELLPLRDILDKVMVRTNGAFVAGYELRGCSRTSPPMRAETRPRIRWKLCSGRSQT